MITFYTKRADMAYSSTRGYTPDPIRKLIMITCAIAIFTAFSESAFRLMFGWEGLYRLLALSRGAIDKFFLWQIFTYMFVQPNPMQGISIFFILGLAFNMYILWAFGSQLLSSVGTAPFMRFYFGVGVLAAVLGLGSLLFTGSYQTLGGAYPSILAILTVWTMLYPETEILLFFAVPVKAKWLLVIIITTIFLMTLSSFDFVGLIFNLSGSMIGYLYALAAWDLRGPFAFSQTFDRGFAAVWRHRPKKEASKSKVIDIKTGKPLQEDEEDQFVDAMLAKISKHGEKSLNYMERERMKAISDKKRKNR